MCTTENKFGLLQVYHHQPFYDPNQHVLPEELADFKTPDDPLTPNISKTFPKIGHLPPPWPFENMSKFLLMH